MKRMLILSAGLIASVAIAYAGCFCNTLIICWQGGQLSMDVNCAVWPSPQWSETISCPAPAARVIAVTDNCPEGATRKDGVSNTTLNCHSSCVATPVMLACFNYGIPFTLEYSQPAAASNITGNPC